MKKGGYQIVNLKETALTSGTGKTIKGTFEQATGARNKRTIVSGLKVGSNTVTPDFETPFKLVSTTAKATFSGGKLSITNADLVTYTAD